MAKAKDNATVSGDSNTETVAIPEQPIEAPSDAQIQVWKNLNIAYCSTCGEKLLTNLEGLPLCPIKKADCDRNL